MLFSDDPRGADFTPARIRSMGAIPQRHIPRLERWLARRPPRPAGSAGRCVLLWSGGLDSTVLLWWLAREGWEVEGLTLAYGQRHSREIQHAQRIARSGRAPLARHRIANLPALAAYMPGSPVTDPSLTLPQGPETLASAQLTYAPARNATLLAIAWGHALGIGADAVAIAVWDGKPEDESGGEGRASASFYPDNGTPFLRAFERMERQACRGMHPYGKERQVRLLAPFIDLNHAEVVALGTALHVPMHLTWTCWDGGTSPDGPDAEPCGTCVTCQSRATAFAANGLTDPALLARAI